jgi:micrococcal nuclease
LYSKLTRFELDQIKVFNIPNWIYESRKHLDNIYAFSDNNLDQEYVQKSKPILEEQLMKAAIRLSVVLEKVLANKTINPIKETTISIAKSNEPITATEASKHIGETLTVCDKVYGTKYLETSSSAPTFLNLGAAYPNSPFSVVIFGKDRSNFKEKPELYYDNKKVCVTGLIKEFKGKPEMIIAKDNEIRIEN